MPTVIYVNFNDSTPVITPNAPEWNYNLLTHVGAGGVMSADLFDDGGNSTGISLNQITADLSSFESAANATSSASDWPESVFDSALVWNLASGTQTIEVVGLVAGQGFTIELAGQRTQNGRHADFTVNGVTARYLNENGANPSAPVSISGSVNASGKIVINMDAVLISATFNGFKLTLDDAVTLTPDQTNISPGDTGTFNTSLTDLTGAWLSDAEGNQFVLSNVTDSRYDVPDIAPLLNACLFGAVTLTVTDGENTASAGITLAPPVGYTVVTLASLPDRALTGTDWVYGFDTPAEVGEQSLDNSPIYTHNNDASTSGVVAGTYSYFTIDLSGVVSLFTKTFASDGSVTLPVGDDNTGPHTLIGGVLGEVMGGIMGQSLTD